MTRLRARILNGISEAMARREARQAAAILNSNDGGLLVHVAIERGDFDA